jgi:hypothetical protein
MFAIGNDDQQVAMLGHGLPRSCVYLNTMRGVDAVARCKVQPNLIGPVYMQTPFSPLVIISEANRDAMQTVVGVVPGLCAKA